MRSAAWFRIPMRGYEVGSAVTVAGELSFRIPMRGYEVMSMPSVVADAAFRIPMRGYESFTGYAGHRFVAVPNPHEGL